MDTKRVSLLSWSTGVIANRDGKLYQYLSTRYRGGSRIFERGGGGPSQAQIQDFLKGGGG